ncbi:DUF2993 domain-containing protein [Chlorogloeopsis sp. ULAP02]|uniref:LmeA family phospholipid-binding protein n=1 Tax=Chlorogloeopsis sp. ULAP02 TaxID=3107926 RepID=UPI0031366915
MSENNLETQSSQKKLRIVTNVLKAALKVWLRSQVSQISELEVEIKASDRQILSGSIPLVSISASYAVYKGLHVRQIQLIAQNIRINIGSVLKGQPLRLLETVPVSGEISLEEDDLNASIASTLLVSGLNELLDKLSPEQRSQSKSIIWQKIILGNGHFILYFSLFPENNSTPSEMCVRLKLLSQHELQVTQFFPNHNTEVRAENENEHYIDLGSEVDIQELQLIPGKVVCRGQVNVKP